jgi:hypothetical protein
MRNRENVENCKFVNKENISTEQIEGKKKTRECEYEAKNY